MSRRSYYSDEEDEFAKRFDNFMYGLILAKMEKSPAFRRAKQQFCSLAAALERKAAVPQVAEKLDFIREAQTEEFWNAGDVLLFERARRELRGLIKFLDDGGEEQPARRYEARGPGARTARGRERSKRATTSTTTGRRSTSISTSTATFRRFTS